MQSVYVQDKPNYVKHFFIFLGNILVFVFFALLVGIYLPIMQLYISPPQVHTLSKSKGFYLTIPKLNAQAPILINVDGTSPQKYHPNLHAGLAHVQGTAIPGEAGTTFIIAQGEGLPWVVTRENTAFSRLKDLEINDHIILTRDGEDKNYLIWSKKEVWPDQVHDIISTVTDNSQNNQLIIQADTPIGTSFKRILIFAASK